MALRPARHADASSLAALSIEVWLGTYLRHGINGFFADYVLSEFTQAKMETMLAQPDETVIVSENRDGIDAVLRITANRPAPVQGGSDLEISTLYVQPRHHGTGIGHALLRAAFDHAAQCGAPSVWLATNSENTPAIGFYLRHGFVQVGYTHFRLGDQAYLNNVYAYNLP